MSQSTSQFGAGPTPGSLSQTGRVLVLAAAFLGWLFAGTQMSITPLVSRSATVSLLWPDQETLQLTSAQQEIVGRWFAWYTAAFLFGAAAGGLVFGWLGDRAGRARAMGLSILCFTLLTGVSYLAHSPEEFLVLRFLACLGVGGMWPNGVALVAEAWSEVSRPTLAGIIGTAANVGIMLVGILGVYIDVTPASWRWLMLAGASPAILGVLVLLLVPESPRWLAGRQQQFTVRPPAPISEVLRPPLLGLTLIGICLGTIPLLGGWGSGNWLVPWSDQVGAMTSPEMKGWTIVSRSFGGTLGSLAGGWVAGWLGRRRSYFLISLGSLAISAYIFRELTPLDRPFYYWAFALGVVSGLYFGWLPLCLPEMFPTRVRSTGAGISFNFGRIGAALGVLGAGELIKSYYHGDYGKVGATTSLIYVLGMVVIWLAPNKSDGQLKD